MKKQMAKEQQALLIKKLYQERDLNNTGISIEDVKSIFRQSTNSEVAQHIIDTAFSDYIQTNQMVVKTLGISFKEAYQYMMEIKKRLDTEKSNMLGLFIFNSLLIFSDNTLKIQKEEQEFDSPNQEIPKEIKDFLSEQNYKKQNGLAGLITEKQQCPEDYYLYNQHISCKVEITNDRTDIAPERMLARAVWNFDFSEADRILKNSNLGTRYPKQMSLLTYIIVQFKDIHYTVTKEKQLSKYFCNRKAFEMGSESEIRKNSDSEKDKSKISNKLHTIKSRLELIITMAANISQAIEINKYLKAIAIFLGNRIDRKNVHYDEITMQKALNIKDRFVFAKKYLSAKQYQSFKIKVREEVLNSDNLQNILVFGKQIETQTVLQNYLDSKMDIKLVALLAVYFKTLKFACSKKFNKKSTTYQDFILVYKRFIDKQGNDKIRIEFEKKCDEIEKQYNGKSQAGSMTFVLKCFKCGSQQSHRYLLKAIDPKKKSYTRFAKDQRKRLTVCPQCLEILPICCICLLPVAIKNPFLQYDPQRRAKKIEIDEGVDSCGAIMWCQTCKHGGHFEHLMKWGKREKRCPVSNCDCLCFD